MTKWIRGVVALVLLGSAASSGAVEPEEGGVDLDRKIEHFTITSGTGIGGAEMVDVVRKLRGDYGVPVHFENLDLSHEEHAVSLADAIRRMERLHAEGKLAESEVRSLEGYYQLAARLEDPDSYTLMLEFPVLKVDVRETTLRGLLDRVAEAAPAYSWRTIGSAEATEVLIEPSEGSVLDWPVPPLCEGGQSVRSAWAEGGRLRELFFAHDLQLLGLFGDGEAAELPRAYIELCEKGLTARKVLTRTADSLGPNTLWAVLGRKGFRVVSFETYRQGDGAEGARVQEGPVRDGNDATRLSTRGASRYRSPSVSGRRTAGPLNGESTDSGGHGGGHELVVSLHWINEGRLVSRPDSEGSRRREGLEP